MPSPIPAPPPFASATLSGLVSTSAQQFAGDKTFLGKILGQNVVGLGTFTNGTLPSAAANVGAILYNSTVAKIQFSNGTIWASLDSGAGSFVQTTGDTMTGQLNIVGAGLVVDTADATLVVDATNNRVGILNASPSYELDVQGTIRATTQVNLFSALANTKLAVFDDSSRLVGLGYQTNDFRLHIHDSSDKFSFRVGAGGSSIMELLGSGNLAVGTNKLFVDAANTRVGIGTNSPGFTLSVNGIISTSSGGVRFPDATTQTTAFVPTSYVAKIGDTMSGQLNIQGAGLDVDSLDHTLYVDATNNRVGIGTNAPVRSLDIRESLATDHLVQIQNQDVTGSSSIAYLDNAAAEKFRVGYANPSFTGTPLAGLNFLSTDSNTDLIIAHAGTLAHRFYSSSNVKFDTVDNLLFLDAVNNRIGVLQGTPSTAHLLDLNATVGSNGSVIKVRNNSASGHSGIEFFNSSGSSVGALGWDNNSVTDAAINHFSLNIPSGFYVRNGTNTFHYFDPSWGNITFDTNDNTVFIDSLNNRVSFNTASFPANVGGSYTTPFLIDVGTSGTKTVLIRGGGTIQKGISVQDTTNNRTWTLDHRPSGENNRWEGWYHDGTTAVRKFVWTTQGRLGIGDITPVVELDVLGAGQFTGNLTVDVNTLLVNAGNHNVGIGEAAASTEKLHLAGDVGQLPFLLRNNGNAGMASFEAYSQAAGTATTGMATLQFRAARNTSASPSPVQLDDHIGAISGRGYGATAFPSTSRASFIMRAAENWTDTTQGTYIDFNVTPIGSTTPALAMQIKPDGSVAVDATTLYVDATNNRVGVNKNNPGEALDVTGNILASGTVTGSNLSGTNTGDVTLAAVGSSPNANGASLSGQALNLQPADGSNPGVLTAGTQTIGGSKTFSAAVSAPNIWTPSYSELYENNDPSGTNITITTAGTYYQWVSTTVGTEAGAGFAVGSASTDNITIGASGAGKYRVTFSAVVTGNNNATVHGLVHKNGSATHLLSGTKINASGDRHAVTITGFLTLASTDTVDLRFTSDTNGDTVTVFHANLNIEKVAN